MGYWVEAQYWMIVVSVMVIMQTWIVMVNVLGMQYQMIVVSVVVVMQAWIVMVNVLEIPYWMIVASVMAVARVRTGPAFPHLCVVRWPPVCSRVRRQTTPTIRAVQCAVWAAERRA